MSDAWGHSWRRSQSTSRYAYACGLGAGLRGIGLCPERATDCGPTGGTLVSCCIGVLPLRCRSRTPALRMRAAGRPMMPLLIAIAPSAATFLAGRPPSSHKPADAPRGRCRAALWWRLRGSRRGSLPLPDANAPPSVRRRRTPPSPFFFQRIAIFDFTCWCFRRRPRPPRPPRHVPGWRRRLSPLPVFPVPGTCCCCCSCC